MLFRITENAESYAGAPAEALPTTSTEFPGCEYIPARSETEARLQIDTANRSRIGEGSAGGNSVWRIKKSRAQNAAGICVVHFIENIARNNSETQIVAAVRTAGYAARDRRRTVGRAVRHRHVRHRRLLLGHRRDLIACRATGLGTETESLRETQVQREHAMDQCRS
jgi:hypothetical protein